ncbi:MAG: hypothetical protein AAGA60_02330 [Cyanobacteria bacterium P01_E01_bin.42]
MLFQESKGENRASVALQSAYLLKSFPMSQEMRKIISVSQDSAQTLH